MIIGVDAGAISVSDDRLKVGVHKVSLRLLEQLARMDRNNSYRLYTFGPVDEGIRERLGPRMEIVRLARRGWSKVWLPLELQRRPVQVFLGLSQFLPPSLRSYNIGFVYDVGFLAFPHLYPDSAAALRSRTRDLTQRSDQIVCVSHATASEMKRHFDTAEKQVVVAPLGCDAIFSPKGPTQARSCRYFLFVGALKRGKNIASLLAGFAQFIKTVSQPHDLLLVGSDWWLDPEIEKTIRQLNLGSRVKRLGHVSDEELAGLYRGAVAFISTSLVEGFCLPAVEAMASGCPVIVSDIAVMHEVVDKAGLFVSPSDPRELTRAMQLIAQTRGVRRSLRSLGQKQAASFSWTGFAEIIYGLYPS